MHQGPGNCRVEASKNPGSLVDAAEMLSLIDAGMLTVTCAGDSVVRV